MLLREMAPVFRRLCVSRVRPNMILNMYVIRFIHTQWYIYTATDPCGINKVQSVAARNGPSISSPRS